MIWLYWLWRVGMFLVGIAPPRLCRAIADAMGVSAYYLMPLRRRIAKENFAHVLGKSPNDPAVRRVARRSLQNFARYLLDVMLYPRLSMEELEQRVILHGSEYLDQAFGVGRGVIIVSAHFGNMDMTSAVLTRRYKPLTLVGETLRPRELMDLLTRVRRARNVYLYPYDRAPRKIIEALKRNEMTGFLMDFGVTHHFDITTVTVNFFDTPTMFPAGPAQLALLTGAPIIVGHACVAPDGRISAYATPPIIVARSGERQETWRATMQEIAARMEDFIRRHPDQWYIFRPMWRVANGE